MANLGNQKIKDTYTSVLQTDVSGNLQRLDGSTPNPFTINQNLRYLDGTTHPNGYVLTSDGSGNASWGAVAFSGDVYISGGSIEGTTIELNASSGGTIYIPGLSWSANTDGSVSPSGTTTDVRLNGNTYVAGDIVGTSGHTKITNNIGGYVEVMSDHDNYGLIVRASSGTSWGNISANEGNLRLNYSTFAANQGIFITEPTNNTQMVGINDATPSYTLDVNGDVRVTDNLIVGDDLTVNFNNLFVDSSIGKVGVGTVVPDARLTVSGTNDLTLVTFNLNGGIATFRIGESRVIFSNGANTDGLSVGDIIEVTEQTTTLVTISSIGDQTTIYLTVNFPAPTIAAETFNYGSPVPPKLFKVYSGDSVSFQVSGMTIMSGSTDMLDIFASSDITNQDVYWSANTDGSISPSGLTTNIGVGTTTPNKPLTVVGDISGTTDLYAGGNIQSDGYVEGTYFNSKTSATGIKLNGAKYLWASGSDLQVGNTAAGTDIIGTSINLQTATTINDDLTVTGNTYVTGNTHVTGNVISANEDVIMFSNRGQGQTDITHWYGPNYQGIWNYSWSKDYGDDTEVLTLDKSYINSGILVPYDCVLTGFFTIGHTNTGDEGYSCGLWYITQSNLAPALNIVGESPDTATITLAGSGTTITPGSGADNKQPLTIDRRGTMSVTLTTGSMVYPRVGDSALVTDTTWNVYLKRT